MKRGNIVRFLNPVGCEDQSVARIVGDRCAAVHDPRCEPHGYARIAFYGDAKGRTYLVHPESLEIVNAA